MANVLRAEIVTTFRLLNGFLTNHGYYNNQYTLYTDVYWFNMHIMETDILNNQLNKWKLQLRKGVLLHMTLSLLNKEEMYGYALISFLSKKMNADMAEGTIYPLLNRMVRDGSIRFEWRIMQSGPARKYYQITPQGQQLLKQMHQHWQLINKNLQVLNNE